MNARHRDVSTETGTSLDAEGPLRRWARRRREVAREEEALAEARRRVAPQDRPQDRPEDGTEAPETGADATEPAGVEDTVLTDEDMPSLESLDDDSDYSGFLSPGVSERLRRRALRKLFTSAVFNVPDGLDDYDDDFTSFEALGDIVTSDMRHQAEVEEERARQAQARQAQAETEPACGSQEGSGQSEDEPPAHADEAAASPTEEAPSREESGRSEGEPPAHADEAAASPTEEAPSREESGRSEGEPPAHADEAAASPAEEAPSREESGRSEGEPLAHADEAAASPTEEAPRGEAGPADPEARADPAVIAGSEPPQVGMAEDSPQRSERADPAPTEPESGSEPMHAREPDGRIATGPTDRR